MHRTAMGRKSAFGSKLIRDSCIALLGAQPVLLVGALPLAFHATAASAQTQRAEAVAKVAQAITVRIEGATQGSGVLVKRDGNRYTVLTAWHVVSGQRPGEELEVFTSDAQRHLLEQGSIKRLGEVDLAVLSFTSPSSYELLRLVIPRAFQWGVQSGYLGFHCQAQQCPHG